MRIRDGPERVCLAAIHLALVGQATSQALSQVRYRAYFTDGVPSGASLPQACLEGQAELGCGLRSASTAHLTNVGIVALQTQGRMRRKKR